MITTIAGTGDNGCNGDDTLATRASLKSPVGIFVDADSQVYISCDQCIRKVDQHAMITTIVGTSESGYSGDVPFDFHKYPHIRPRKKPLIKPFPHAYHDLILYSKATQVMQCLVFSLK